ncbi:uncharacterized protein [Chanodichthys erythropterus]|uniref:uncharacterized protein n=1 Tax=Chanodichthys erythropterus TaxID=933992 RepID=UPI00351F6AEC
MLTSGRTPQQACQQCHVEEAVIRCRDCLPKELYCSNCDVSVHHQYVLHNRESFVGGFYKAMSPKCIVTKDSTGEHVVSEHDCLLPIALPNKICCCGAEDVSVNAGRAIIFININGRYDLSLPLVTCKSCLKSWTPEVKDLILNGYWPGTIEFQTVYTVDLFSTFEDFKVTAPGLSRQAFVRMLQSRSMRSGRVGTISVDCFQRSFLEWTYCRHEMETLLGDDHFSCPACSQDMLAVSLDGNRKMYRFNRNGINENPYFDGTFFAKNEEVAEFLQTIRDKIKTSPGRTICGNSHFKAGSESNKKSQSKLDEEGVMISVCRHCILLNGLQMYRGEVFAYPLYLQKELGKTQKIEFVCTDVMCKYYPYLKRVCEAFPDLEYLLQMRPFLSVMHAKGHSTKCEVEWGGRNQEGAGLTVGEEVEAVNSFMSRAALTTKYMTKSARTDMITIHVRGWNLRKKLNLHNYLAQRYVKTLQRTAEVAGEIEMTKSHLNKTSEDLQQWVTDVQLWAASTPSTISSHDPQGLQRLMEGLVLKIHQKKMELYRETDSNKDRRRKRSAIAKEKSKLEEAITSYNALVSNAEAVDPADTLLAQEFSIWPWETESTVPLRQKKIVFDKIMLLSRLKEEKTILIKEMKQHWQFLAGVSKTLGDDIKLVRGDLKEGICPTNMSVEAYEGLCCIMLARLSDLQHQMSEVKSKYRQIVVDPSVLSIDEEDGEAVCEEFPYLHDDIDSSDED